MEGSTGLLNPPTLVVPLAPICALEQCYCSYCATAMPLQALTAVFEVPLSLRTVVYITFALTLAHLHYIAITFAHSL